MSPFDVLGIDPGADQAEIERAYRRRVLETHPDHGGSPREFRRVRAAYEQLAADDRSDPAGERSGGAVERDVNANRDADVERDVWDAGRAGEGDAAGAGDGASASRADTGSHDDDGDAGKTRHCPDGRRVEYLDYEVLVDRGWDLADRDLFERASAATLDPSDHGRLLVRPGESLLEAAEGRGFSWPYACRGGACANCAVAVLDGELSMPVDHILPPGMVDRGFRLSCVGAPTTAETKVVYGVKHLPDLDELRLPPHPFEQSRRDG